MFAILSSEIIQEIASHLNPADARLFDMLSKITRIVDTTWCRVLVAQFTPNVIDFLKVNVHDFDQLKNLWMSRLPPLSARNSHIAIYLVSMIIRDDVEGFISLLRKNWWIWDTEYLDDPRCPDPPEADDESQIRRDKIYKEWFVSHFYRSRSLNPSAQWGLIFDSDIDTNHPIEKMLMKFYTSDVKEERDHSAYLQRMVYSICSVPPEFLHQNNVLVTITLKDVIQCGLIMNTLMPTAPVKIFSHAFETLWPERIECHMRQNFTGIRKCFTCKSGIEGKFEYGSIVII